MIFYTLGRTWIITFRCVTRSGFSKEWGSGWGQGQGLKLELCPGLMQLAKNGKNSGWDVDSGSGEMRTDTRSFLEVEMSGLANLFIQFINSTFLGSVDIAALKTSKTVLI